jgi:hypothetical protein
VLGLGIKGVLRSFLLYPAVEQGRLAALYKGVFTLLWAGPFQSGISSSVLGKVGPRKSRGVLVDRSIRILTIMIIGSSNKDDTTTSNEWKSSPSSN